MMNRICITATGALLFFLNVQAQSPLVTYAAASFKDGVLISFTMRGGFSCNGINIERSEDSVSFSVIGDIEGICGSPDFDLSFTYTDRQPLSFRKNFYRLDMKQLGYSPVFSVFYASLNTAEILILPNPCSEKCNLYFENAKREKVVIKLFHNGKEMLSQITDQDFIAPDMQPFASGIYHCLLQYPDGTLLNRKLVLLKK
jgi:hypothetical protein